MRSVRVIRMDRSGHFQGVVDVGEFQEYDWTARREVVIVGDTQVETFEDFLRATEQSRDETPEVWFFPPHGRGVGAHLHVPGRLPCRSVVLDPKGSADRFAAAPRLVPPPARREPTENRRVRGLARHRAIQKLLTPKEGWQ